MEGSTEARYRRLAAQAGLDFVSLDPAPDDPVQRGAARLVSPALARRLGALPVAATAQGLVVAVSSPDAEAVAAAIGSLTGQAVRLVIAPPEQIARAHERVFGAPPALRVPRFAPPPELPRGESAAFPRRVAERAGLGFAPLAHGAGSEVDPAAAQLVGERLSRRLHAVGLATSAGELTLAVARPLDEGSLRLVESVTGYRPVQVIAPADRVAAAIERAFAARARVAPPPEPRAAEPGRRLGEILVAAGALAPETLTRALAVQRRTGGRLGTILLSLGAIGHDRLAASVAAQLRLPHVRDLHARRASEVAAILPESVCRANRLVPLEVVDGTLVVAMADPLDADAAAALRESCPLPTRIVVASDADIEAMLKRVHAPHYVEVSTSLLLRRRPDESAFRVLSRGQEVAGGVFLALLALGLGLAAIPTLVTLALASIVFYTVVSAYKFYLVYRTLRRGTPEIRVREEELALLEDRVLPPYTVLVPLYREAAVLPQLLEALDALDYPKSKLDVKLLLEEDDHETVAAVRRTRLGAHYDIVIVPDSQPKTKPKACNYGLQHARGRYVVIFDAEDLPEPDQLKKAVAAFRRVEPRVVCIQAKLNYWNRDQNLLTRWFTAEYSQWFDLFLPGLDDTDAPIPLGGTSNHFVVSKLLELGAWDPFNVTEDADVGIRLARAGYRTAMMQSTTYEEANPRVYNWIRQRSRWVKGYVQTWLVHMRHPLRLWRELGPANFVSFQLVVGGTFLTMLLNPLFWGLTSLWALTKAQAIREIFPGFIYFAAAFNLLVGNFVFTYMAAAGAMRRGYHDLVRYALLSPLYWALMSVGAWKGLGQLVTRPSYWEKTVHGLAGRHAE